MPISVNPIFPVIAAQGVAPDVVLQPGTVIDAQLPKNPLTPLQSLAVSAAAQTAATRQGSLAPLFANLEVVAVSDALPANLQQAVAPLLALRPNLDQSLTGSDVKAAFKNSGLFLE